MTVADGNLVPCLVTSRVGVGDVMPGSDVGVVMVTRQYERHPPGLETVEFVKILDLHGNNLPDQNVMGSERRRQDAEVDRL